MGEPKTAIILFNLGGPDGQAAVKPFLFNLFHDPAIVRLPKPLRYLVAKLISTRREKFAQAIYAKLGGGSPILKNTRKQAEALERKTGMRCFIAMRYWHPFAEETLQTVKAYAPDRIVLLPLYPQFSTTTTASSLDQWRRTAQAAGINTPTKTICCYPEEKGFIAALARRIRTGYEQARRHGRPRLLFSAHGLPKKIVAAGDPYPLHCRKTVEALLRELNMPDLDAVLCYQSRVGPLEWIGPATDDEVRRAGLDQRPLVVAPIAFVSEHSETLVELDIEYRHLATQCGVPFYAYTGTVSEDEIFINGLAKLVTKTISGPDCISGGETLACPPNIRACPCRRMETKDAV